MPMKKTLTRSTGSLPNLQSLTQSPTTSFKRSSNPSDTPSRPLSSKPKILDTISRKSIDITSLSPSPTSKSRKVIQIDTTKTPKATNSPNKFTILGSFRLSPSPLIIPSSKKLSYIHSPSHGATFRDFDPTVELAEPSNLHTINSPTGISNTIMTSSIKPRNKGPKALTTKAKDSTRPMSSIGTINSPMSPLKKGKTRLKGKRKSLPEFLGTLEPKSGNKEDKVLPGKIQISSAFETPLGSPQNTLPDQPDTPGYSEFKNSVREASLSPKNSGHRRSTRKLELTLEGYSSSFLPRVMSMPNSPNGSQLDFGSNPRVSSLDMDRVKIEKKPSRILSKELEAKYGVKLYDDEKESDSEEEESKNKMEVGLENKRVSVRDMIWNKQTPGDKAVLEEKEEEKKKIKRARLRVKASTEAPKDDLFKIELKKKFENFVGIYMDGPKSGGQGDSPRKSGRYTSREQELLMEQYKPMMVRMNEEGNKIVKPRFMKNMGTMCYTELWPRELRIRMQMMLEKKTPRRVKKEGKDKDKDGDVSIEKGRLSRRESQVNATAAKRLKEDTNNFKSWKDLEMNSNPCLEKMKVRSVEALGTRGSLNNMTPRLW